MTRLAGTAAAFLALAGAAACGRENGFMYASHPAVVRWVIPDSGEDATARAAVVMYRGSVTRDAGPSTLDRVRVLPDRAVLTESQAAARLAAMPKPVECAPSMDNGVLVLECSHREWASVNLHAWEESGDAARTGGRRGILFGGGEAIAVEAEVLRHLMFDYESRGSTGTISGTPASFGHPEHGGAWAESYIPPDDDIISRILGG